MDDIVQSEALATGASGQEIEVGSTASPLLRAAALALGVLFILTVGWLSHLESGGPAHMSFDLPGNEPATIYLPGEGDLFFRAAPPSGERPAAVVLVHGYTADRQI